MSTRRPSPRDARAAGRFVRRRALPLALLAGVACAARAQDAPDPRQPLSIVPYVSVSETYTDNSRGTTQGRSEFITEASAGVSLRAATARLQGYLDYELTGVLYARNSASDRVQHYLNAYLTGALVEKRVFVDVAGSVSQQVASVFGTRTADPASANDNRAEVSTFLITPYVNGRLGSFAEYQARLSMTKTSGDVSTLSDVTTKEASLQLAGDASLYPFGWSAQMSRETIDYSVGREYENDVAQAVLNWAVTSEVQLSLIGGKEANNFLGADKTSHDTWGARASWVPSERTSALVEGQRRFFGNAHKVTFAYRTPRTTWTLSDTRDVSTTPGQPRIGSLGTAYDVFFNHFATAFPDPVVRQQVVNQFLAQYGIDPRAQVISALLVSSATLERLQQLSFAWRGQRDAIVVSAVQSTARRLDQVTSVLDDFSFTQEIRQRGLSANLAHRLTPVSSLGLVASWQRVIGDNETTTLRSLGATLSANLGRRSDGSLGLRHSRFSGASSYNETALTATFSMRF